jgi:signal transduction histidine kinase
MSIEGRDTAGTSLDATELIAATTRWHVIQDELVTGIAHALSNRVGALSAGIFMLGESDTHSAKALAGLQSEVDLMEQLLVQLRLLRREDAGPEPLVPGDSVRTAVALHEHFGSFRSIRCTIEETPDVPPVRVVPQHFIHALLVAITAAKQAASDAQGALVRMEGDGDVVRITATISGDERADELDTRFAVDALAANELLASSRGRAFAHANGCVIEVPTLASTRRSRS